VNASSNGIASDEKMPRRHRLNPKVLKSLQGLEEAAPGFFREVLNLYVTDGREYVRQIRDATLRRDAEALRRPAHSLKGSSGNIGAEELALYCENLENAAQASDWTALSELLTCIEGEFLALTQVLAREETTS
jgi:HPt (histidine-containing phosphotransfer) domain-containing protein